jgi:DNA-binding transcriptional LysR family regulator
MDRLRSIQVFVSVAERGGFAPAARALAMSPPAVTRSMAALEDHLGVRLLHRTTRSVRLTEAGARFLEHGQRLLLDLQAAEEAALGAHGVPRGMLRVMAPMLFGRLYVTPILGAFLDLYPEVTCQTLFLDRSVNLMDEGLDVAVSYRRAAGFNAYRDPGRDGALGNFRGAVLSGEVRRARAPS